MSNYHLGINLGHDRAAALVCDGEILAAIHQERIDRCKHSVGVLHQSLHDLTQVQPPDEAVRYCLDSVGIRLSDVATITANMPGVDYGPDILRRKLSPELADRVLRVPSHHMAHAYSAYWPSGFDEALILVVDASGSTTADHQTESYSLYAAHGEDITEVYSHKIPAHLASLSTLGFLYEYISRKAGFVTEIGSAISIPEAGKLMGLASYGGRQHNWHRWIKLIEGEKAVAIPAYDIFLEVAALEKHYDKQEGKAYLRPYLVDLACKVQSELEEALLHIVAQAVRETGLRRLCMAGGVALNSVANYRLLRDLELDDVFVFPAAGDAGIAAGCALWAHATQDSARHRVPLKSAALGRRYPPSEIARALETFGDEITVEELSPQSMLSRTADTLVQGHIVARFEGRSEYGPRALGQRSIMVDPVFSRMKDVLNARVKFREAFRPFAPVIPEERISEVFEHKVASPFMLIVSPIKSHFQTEIPAVTHSDGTGRVQTVTKEDNPFFYDICHRLSKLRDGPPVVLNTSFNIAGQPIVETPEEAIATFLRTDIDYLSIENFWLQKTGVPIKRYDDHLAGLGEDKLPQGLPSGQPSVHSLMRRLDRALFWDDVEGCPWSEDELQRLSSQGARYKESSVLFADNPFGRPFQTQLAPEVVLLLDPRGESILTHVRGTTKPGRYSFDQVKLIMSLLAEDDSVRDSLRTEQQFTTREWDRKMSWAVSELARFGLKPSAWYRECSPQDSAITEAEVTPLEPAAVSS
ncbi:carbamoyltransferase C-terminal domain-containing protein [Thiocystis violacea]|uniref:carbamoyltransferase C-terminal domain-containing protein n=1 Tax=Thiocystis violacea TaxID=13725 RepID=UPI001905D79A